MHTALKQLTSELEGELFTDEVQRLIYSTDASHHREKPLAVAKPKHLSDIRKIIAFADAQKTSVIPRGGGTSLAGQVTGPGIVVDISKHMNQILEFNPEERWIWVEPGVIPAELNQFLAPYGLQYGPETSTANRCCIGGMLGNNSCGLHSIIYGAARDHILEVDAILSDGSEVRFKPLSRDEFEEKCNDGNQSLETRIYQNIKNILSDKANQNEIRTHFPDPKVTRRNMGYALDVLLGSELFTPGGQPFNFCKLLAGSEGTLAFTTRMKLNLIPLPPPHIGLVCAHFETLEQSLFANIIALKHQPGAVELMDDVILNCTKENIEQNKNRFFVEGNPGAILMIEFACETEEDLQAKASAMEAEMRDQGLGYAFPMVTGKDRIRRVWALRTAGLGVLSNLPGERKGIEGAEDTAVAPEFLPAYVAEFKKVLEKYGLSSVYYAHIGAGEIHFKPLLNFRDPGDVRIFRDLMQDLAGLVKKFRGSLSGEHGDGRVRGAFIPFMLGDHNYQLFRQIKYTWDPHNVFNPGKIVDTPPITDFLRVESGQKAPEYRTVFDFSMSEGFFQSIEKCNGSGDCRKSHVIGGTMCPTYMATRDEDKTTRGRANLLRELLAGGGKDKGFAREEIYKILDLCISCKACKSECPSNVDMAKLKAEFLQHYYDVRGIPLRTRLVAWLPRLEKLAMLVSPIANRAMSTGIFKKSIGFAKERSLPALSKVSLKTWFRKQGSYRMPDTKDRQVWLFMDEFSNFHDTDLGIKAIRLLTRMGYQVRVPKHKESGRTWLSKGLIRTAAKIAKENVLMLKDIVDEHRPLVGIEPSAILAFRDEYPDLAGETLRPEAEKLAKNALLFEEFFVREAEKGHIDVSLFTTEAKEILLHGHCQQKAIASTVPTKQMLSFPENYSVEEIPSGCCGMAGSFGYEAEHYELSMKIGELILFPAVRKAGDQVLVAAPGTSCRHQVKDGTGREALHPVEIMYEALVD
ncbi:MAG TPA: FAD-binding oxidoreductase [Saprospirales bacterium]|nr:FAD-binding oxidoreductase [Saprospirales bacterium]HAY71422.1 FAD-binding oxidoreductase [Saprospirales bacterium]